MNIHGYPIPVGEGDPRFRRFEALFDDPATNERLKTEVRQQDGDFIAEIENTPDDDHYGRGMTTHRSSGKERAGGLAMNTFADPERPVYAMEGVGVEEKYRRRGYATALYDLVARVLSDQGLGPIVPSDTRSDDAMALWGDKVEWPVRDDL